MKALLTQTPLFRCNSPCLLYPLFGQSCSPSALISLKVSPTLLHHRLAHPDTPVMQQFLQENIHLCTSKKFDIVFYECQLGNHVRLPFSSSSTTSSKPLLFIHFDVWSSPIFSFSGYRYYVLFLDDFSCYCWVYPLFNKHEGFSVILQFKNKVENQFSKTIQSFQ